jgi:integrase
MPLKLRKHKSPYWSIRGTYLGQYVDRSTGTGEKALATKHLKELKAEIERGAFKKKDAVGFGAAAAAYISAGGEARFLAPIIEHFKDTPLEEINQIAIDNCAAAIYPNGTATSRARMIYTPISAVMHRAGDLRPIMRPKGSKSKKKVSWLRREQAFALFAAADAEDAEFGLLVRLYCYTGMRRSEALARITIANVDLKNATIYVPETKNGEARNVHLTPELVAGLRVHLAAHPERRPADPVFRFRINGTLNDMLKRVMKNAGLSFPTRQGAFHLFRHTWAMWMRIYGGLDTSGLVETGAWKDRDSAARYEHLDTTEEAQKANLLPVMAPRPKLLTDQRG